MPSSLKPLSSALTAKHTRFVKRLLEYINREGADIREEELVFIRSARIEDVNYWIWSFDDEGNQPCHATATEWPGKRIALLCDRADGMTPEQLMWVAHRNYL